MSLTAINFDKVNKSFNSHAVVKNLSFQVKQGECFGLLGPNGAGKTTAIRLLLGLVSVDSGSIHVANTCVTENSYARKARMNVGVVPQFDNLDPDFSVLENLIVYARYFGIDALEAKRRAPVLLDFVQLLHRANDRVSHLSGGMQRRLVIARALINHPKILILDEPTTGLDPQARHIIWEKLRNLKNSGITLLLTTHFMEEAERLCDYLCIVDSGKKLAEGVPFELIQSLIGNDVIEIFGQRDNTFLYDALKKIAQRIETSGETLYCYGDPKEIITHIPTHSNIQYLQRRANLEDVFLRLIGRDIRDS